MYLLFPQNHGLDQNCHLKNWKKIKSNKMIVILFFFLFEEGLGLGLDKAK